MIEPLWSSSTPRILRSIGSSILILRFSRSMAFNSSRVVSMKTSRVMTSPCNVFNLSSHDMAGHTETLQISVQIFLWKKLFDTQKHAENLRIFKNFLGNFPWRTVKFVYVRVGSFLSAEVFQVWMSWCDLQRCMYFSRFVCCFADLELETPTWWWHPKNCKFGKHFPGTGSNNVVDTSWGSENKFPRCFWGGL